MTLASPMLQSLDDPSSWRAYVDTLLGPPKPINFNQKLQTNQVGVKIIPSDAQYRYLWRFYDETPSMDTESNADEQNCATVSKEYTRSLGKDSSLSPINVQRKSKAESQSVTCSGKVSSLESSARSTSAQQQQLQESSNKNKSPQNSSNNNGNKSSRKRQRRTTSKNGGGWISRSTFYDDGKKSWARKKTTRRNHNDWLEKKDDDNTRRDKDSSNGSNRQQCGRVNHNANASLEQEEEAHPDEPSHASCARYLKRQNKRLFRPSASRADKRMKQKSIRLMFGDDS